MKDKDCGCEEIEKSRINKVSGIEESYNDSDCAGDGFEEVSNCGGGEKTLKKSCSDTQSQNDGCGCGVEENKSMEKESSLEEGCGSGCSCGWDKEYPDLSQVENPLEMKKMVDDVFIQKFEEYAHKLGISSIGYTSFNPDILIGDKKVYYPQAIVLTMPMDRKIIKTPPGEEAQSYNDAAYEKLGKITYKLSDYLRQKGYSTQVAHPYEALVDLSALGQKASMGLIGESGLLITPECGPAQKISAIFTTMENLPLREENPHTWIRDYCNRCGKCIKACPEKALIEKETCCGKEVILIQNQCIGCSKGCTYCIEDCPFDTKGYDHIKIRHDKLLSKLKEKNKVN
ncbi:4Fe-4S binding protein [Methanobacterium movens]|nr:4Fe-4S binding protein [Methanobacterium alkalithermotolerans]